MTQTPQRTGGMSAHDLCLDIARLVKQFKQHMAAVAEDHKLTIIQLYALQAMADSDGQLTMGQMAASLHCDASNVTGIVDRLTALHLITRREHPQDRRVKTLALTAAGQRVISVLHDELPERLGCTGLTAIERANLRRLLDKLSPTVHLA